MSQKAKIIASVVGGAIVGVAAYGIQILGLGWMWNSVAIGAATAVVA